MTRNNTNRIPNRLYRIAIIIAAVNIPAAGLMYATGNPGIGMGNLAVAAGLFVLVGAVHHIEERVAMKRLRDAFEGEFRAD